MIELIVTIGLFLLLSGLMAAVEAATLSVTPGEVEELRLAGAISPRAARTLTERLTRPLAVIVIVTNTINVLGPILAGSVAIALYGDVAIGYLTAVLTVGTIVFSEVVPKAIGTHYAPRITRHASPVLGALTMALYPVVVGLERLARLFQVGERELGTEAQIRSLVTIGRRSGHIEDDEGQLIRRAFFLNDRTAADVMTPVERVIALDAGATVDVAAPVVRLHPHSRLPVFGATADEVHGLVSAKMVLTALTDERRSHPVLSLCQPAVVVAGDTSCDDLLVVFRNAKTHMAIVRDGGSTLGVVTLADVLEELVGEIPDSDT